jgi:hypothetical protein
MDRALTEWEERRERQTIHSGFPIHPTVWKATSANFAQPEFSEVSVASARYPWVPLAEMFEDSTKSLVK